MCDRNVIVSSRILQPDCVNKVRSASTAGPSKATTPVPAPTQSNHSCSPKPSHRQLSSDLEVLLPARNREAYVKLCGINERQGSSANRGQNKTRLFGSLSSPLQSVRFRIATTLGNSSTSLNGVLDILSCRFEPQWCGAPLRRWKAASVRWAREIIEKIDERVLDLGGEMSWCFLGTLPQFLWFPAQQ